MKKSIKITHTNDALDIIDMVNSILKEHNLLLIDDGLLHDGYLIFELHTIENVK